MLEVVQRIIPASSVSEHKPAGAAASVFDLGEQRRERAVTVSDVAREVSIASRGDLASDIEAFRERLLEENPAAYEEFVEKAVNASIVDALRNARNKVRSILSGRHASQANAATRPRFLVMRSHAVSWYSWSVLGIPMRDAKRTDLHAAAQKYDGDAKTYTARARWLDAIAAELPDDLTPVAQHIKEARLAELATQCGVASIVSGE